MFELTYLFELFISVIVGIAVLILGVRMIIDVTGMAVECEGVSALVTVLDNAIILAIGAELIKMLCKHTPETVIEVLTFALARQLIVGHAKPFENLVTVVSIAILFAVRRFLFKGRDMVETPDGLVDSVENSNAKK